MARISISKWGNSLAIRVPKYLADDLGLKLGSEISIEIEGGRLVAIPMRKRRRPRLTDLVKRIRSGNRHAATDWGPAVGNEVW